MRLFQIAPLIALGLTAASGPAFAQEKPFDFVSVTVANGETDQSVDLESLASDLGDSGVSEIKGILYSRLIAAFPELKNVDHEHFRRLFAFQIEVHWFGSAEGGMGISFFVDRGFATRSRFPILRQLRQTDEVLEKPEGDDKGPGRKSKDKKKQEEPKKVYKYRDFPMIRDILNGGWDLSPPVYLPPKPDTSLDQVLEGTKLVDGPLHADLPSLLFRVVNAFDISYAYQPGQLGVLLGTLHPELKIFFHLDDVLRLAMSNPDALTGYLREEILSAERSLKDLVARQEITRREQEQRLAELRAELNPLEQRALALGSEVGHLEASRDALVEAVDEMYASSPMSRFDVSSGLQNSQIISDLGTRERIAAVILGFVAGELEENVLLNPEWKEGFLSIQLTPILIRYQENPWLSLGRWKYTSRVEFRLVAELRTPSHTAQVSGAFEAGIGPNGIRGSDVSESAFSSFWKDISRTAEGLILLEGIQPQRGELLENCRRFLMPRGPDHPRLTDSTES